ncbi:hypothetical protein CCASEI_13770 [Corynebacterium casei LMG S-19264]|uniref:Uncharacterized protein n=2 Tax=Corynebacterium casei TaxID=160386 RepID=A0ABM5PTE2_9CORY|nr:hypothetical protein CCASEI_13770 [Corynebacterium casei LMG S-19264]
MEGVSSLVKNIISLLPEYGMEWGLWCDNPPIPTYRGWPPTPRNFMFSKGLEERLYDWLESWRNNYADGPEEQAETWKQGFDKYAWAQEGDALSREIEAECHGYKVRRDYEIYLKSPDRK